MTDVETQVRQYVEAAFDSLVPADTTPLREREHSARRRRPKRILGAAAVVVLTTVAVSWILLDRPARDASVTTGPDTDLPYELVDDWTREYANVLQTPTIVGDTVLVTTGVPNSQSSVLRGLDAGSGRAQWQHRLIDEYVSTIVPVGDHTALVTLSGGDLIAVDTADGSTRWTLDPGGGSNLLRPLVRGSRVFVGASTGEMRSIDLANGDVRWNVPLAPGTLSPTLHDDVLYIASGDIGSGTEARGTVYALDASTGEPVWELPPFPFESPALSPPAVGGGVVAVKATDVTGGSNDSVWVVDSDTGDQWWWYKPGGRVSEPLVMRDVVVVATLAGRLEGRVASVAGDPPGRAIWSTEIGLSTTLAHDEEPVLFRSGDLVVALGDSPAFVDPRKGAIRDRADVLYPTILGRSGWLLAMLDPTKGDLAVVDTRSGRVVARQQAHRTVNATFRGRTVARLEATGNPIKADTVTVSSLRRSDNA